MPRTDLRGVTDLSKITSADINSISEFQGKEFSKNIKTNQIRNVFSAVNRIRTMSNNNKPYTEIERELVLLKPKLAYAAGRNRDVKPFKEFIGNAIDGVVKAENKKNAITNFIALVEAVVAYHKYFGGKD